MDNETHSAPHWRVKDITGKKFGRYTVISFSVTRNRTALWSCRCDCGNEKIVAGSSLRTGAIISCGCYNKEVVTKHGKYGSNSYVTWIAMKSRCLNANHVAYHRYGGRGIKICDRWLNSFSSFLEDMGDRPKGMSIERIKNDLGYFKDNCRWATPKDQTNNMVSNRILSYNGKAMSISLWAKETGIGESTIRERIRHGWPVDAALTLIASKKKFRFLSSSKTQDSLSS